MKVVPKIALATTTVALLGWMPAIAQDQGDRPGAEPGQERPDRPDRPEGERRDRPSFEARFKEMDADANGSVSKQEYLDYMAKRTAERFDEMDEAGKGALTLEEMRQSFRRGGGDRDRGPRDGNRDRPRPGGTDDAPDAGSSDQ